MYTNTYPNTILTIIFTNLGLPTCAHEERVTDSVASADGFGSSQSLAPPFLKLVKLASAQLGNVVVVVVVVCELIN